MPTGMKKKSNITVELAIASGETFIIRCKRSDKMVTLKKELEPMLSEHLKNPISWHDICLLKEGKILDDEESLANARVRRKANLNVIIKMGVPEETAPAPIENGSNLGAVFCQICDKWLNGPIQSENHDIGKKHKRFQRNAERQACHRVTEARHSEKTKVAALIPKPVENAPHIVAEVARHSEKTNVAALIPKPVENAPYIVAESTAQLLTLWQRPYNDVGQIPKAIDVCWPDQRPYDDVGQIPRAIDVCWPDCWPFYYANCYQQDWGDVYGWNEHGYGL